VEGVMVAMILGIRMKEIMNSHSYMEMTCMSLIIKEVNNSWCLTLVIKGEEIEMEQKK
jgi:hypothetical protein